MNSIREWWYYNKDIWFGSTESDDIEICDKFEDEFETILDEDYLIKNVEHGIGWIILHDQISRHVKRARNYSNQFISDKLKLILGFVNKFYQINKLNLDGYDFCFTLLPLRHTNNFTSQIFVIKETWEKLSQYNSETSNLYEKELICIYRNYLKASYERITISSDNLYLNKLILLKSSFDINNKIEEFIFKFSDILDTTCHNYKFDVDNCLLFEKKYLNNNIIKECIRLKNNFPPNIILSISGGVDSMVLSWILSFLKINYVMLHINYANRDEICLKEKEMLSYWANYLNVPIYFRDIDEINRTKCIKWDLRNLYESYTRNVRYQSYIDVAKLNSWDNDCWGVVLGHNHDDCVENIFTNIINKNKYENLYGMEFKSILNFKSNQICFIRPILQISKKQIYNLANQTNIPYLYDSTPKWSQRGKIRDIVRPSLIEWNKSSIDGIDELSKVMTNCIDCVSMIVDVWIKKIIFFSELELIDRVKVKLNFNITLTNSFNDYKPDNDFKLIKINIDELKPNKIFWSKYLEKIYSSNTNSKCIDNFISRIQIFKNKYISSQPKQVFTIDMGFDHVIFNNLLTKINKKIYYWKTIDNFVIIGFDIIYMF